MIKLTPITFDKFIREIDPFSAKTNEIDLTDVSFISPAVLTQLSALCYALSKEKKKITVRLNKDIGRYLVRAGFVKSIRPVAEVMPEEFGQISPSEQLHGSNPLLVEVTKIESLDSLSSLLDRIVIVLRTKLEYSKVEAFDTVTAISEICQNMFDHNNGICGFIAMQVYTIGKKSFLQIGVSDYGDGFWRTLRRNVRNLDLKSHLEAINSAVQAGTSEYDDPTRGTGLYHLLKIMEKNSGVVQIYSGYGKVRYKIDKKTEWDWSIPYLPGVHIVLELDMKKYF